VTRHHTAQAPSGSVKSPGHRQLETKRRDRGRIRRDNAAWLRRQLRSRAGAKHAHRARRQRRRPRRQLKVRRRTRTQTSKYWRARLTPPRSVQQNCQGQSAVTERGGLHASSVIAHAQGRNGGCRPRRRQRRRLASPTVKRPCSTGYDTCGYQAGSGLNGWGRTVPAYDNRREVISPYRRRRRPVQGLPRMTADPQNVRAVIGVR